MSFFIYRYVRLKGMKVCGRHPDTLNVSWRQDLASTGYWTGRKRGARLDVPNPDP